jgi:hypothetical protein
MLKATHSHDQNMIADIVTMNTTLLIVSLTNLPEAIHKTYEPIHMKEPSADFLCMLDWIIAK